MGPVKELFEKFRESDGRIKIATAVGVLGLAIAIALFGVIPALAGNGLPSNAGVQPVEINYGGGSGGCAFIGSTHTELHINNPMTGSYPLPGGGGTLDLVVSSGDTMFSYSFSESTKAAFQITVNGGQKSLKYDNAASAVGPRNSDGGLHAPTKGNSQTNLFKLSHINFCFDTAYGLSGTVYDDANVSGDFESESDTPESGVDITVLASGVSYTVASGTDGGYSFSLSPGFYTVCEETREGRAQTEPTSGADCASLGAYEAFGYGVTITSSAVTGKDFGTATELCGETLTEDGEIFDATIVIFLAGNDEADCEDKAGSLFEETIGEVVTLNFPLTGSGSIAAIADIEKTFTSPTLFVPLQYTQGPGDTTIDDIPWCGLRTKTGTDGNQFDPFLADDSMYPSLSGITDQPSGDPAVACLVKVFEDAEGLQRNILLIQGDPRFY